VNRDPIESGDTPAAATRRRTRWTAVVASTFCSAAFGALAVIGGHRLAAAAVVDLGPTDARYVRGFREIERDGTTYFRWSAVPSSQITAPLRFCGPGTLRIRARRHFEDPAQLTVSMNGSVLGQRAVKALEDSPYAVLEFPISRVTCTSNVSILLESIVTNDRPLGVAVDWAEIHSEAGFSPAWPSMLAGAVVAAAAAGALSLAGTRLAASLGMGAFLSALIALACGWGPSAAERMLRGGAMTLLAVLVLSAVIGRLSILQAVSMRSRQLMIALTILTAVSRTAFLHPQVFYPDYRVHALVQQTLSRLGLADFLDQLFEIQYARSLGLQQIDGRWYPFPYPPGFYVLAGGASKMAGLDSLDSVQVTAAIAASLIPILTMAIGLSLGVGEGACLSAAFFVAFQPLLIRRMALGYFPGVTGQFFDAVGLLAVIRVIRRDNGLANGLPRFGLVLLGSFLVYTQSIANFGLLIAGLLVISIVKRVPSAGLALRISVVALGALLASITVFYARYVPVLQNIASQRPQPEAVVLERLDEIRQSQGHVKTAADEDLNDPYSGPTTDLTRGLLRLGSRLWRFYGLFAVTLVLGGWVLWRGLDATSRSLALAWAGVPLCISLLAAGLASPNGFQHLKDLEFTSPLAGLALGSLTAAIGASRPILAKLFAGFWIAFAAHALAIEFGERLLPLAGL
jgi:hypothetical protein